MIWQSLVDRIWPAFFNFWYSVHSGSLHTHFLGESVAQLGTHCFWGESLQSRPGGDGGGGGGDSRGGGGGGGFRACVGVGGEGKRQPKHFWQPKTCLGAHICISKLLRHTHNARYLSQVIAGFS